MNKPIILFALALLAFMSQSFSQTNLQPGFIVNNNYDTIHGKIEFIAYQSSPVDLVFLQEDGNLKTLSARDIRAFQVSNKLFISENVDIETSSDNLNDLSEEPGLQLERKTVFLQVLVDGSRKLYHHKQPGGNDCFYSVTSNGIELLGYKRYYFKSGIKRYLNYNKKYIAQLMIVFGDYPELSKKINKTQYTEKSLTALFERYYEVSKEPYKTFNTTPFRLNDTYGFMGGISFAQFKLKGSNWELMRYDFDPKITPSFGLYYKFILPRSANRAALRFELDFTSVKAESVFDNFLNSDMYSTITTKANLSRTNLNVFYSYRIPKNKMSLEFDFGAGISRAADRSTQSIYSMYYGIEKTIKKDEIFVGKFEPTVMVGTTFNYKKIGVGLRYEIGSGYLKMSDLKAHTSRIGIVAMIGF